MSSSSLTCLNFDKYVGLDFHEHSIYYNLPFEPPPPHLWVLSVVSPHSFNLSSYLKSLSPVVSLVVLLCILLSIPMPFLQYGLHVCILYTKWGITITLYRGTINHFSWDVIHGVFIRSIPILWLPWEAAILHCSETFLLAFIVTPCLFIYSFTYNSSSQCIVHPSHSMPCV